MNASRERLAAVQHAIWSHWMQYMFTQGTYDELGNWTMPKEKVERWHRQMETGYHDLTEKEKVSDREQADKVIKVINYPPAVKLWHWILEKLGLKTKYTEVEGALEPVEDGGE